MHILQDFSYRSSGKYESNVADHYGEILQAIIGLSFPSDKLTYFSYGAT